MLDSLPHRSRFESDANARVPALAVRTSPSCPNCGHPSVVVFSVIRFDNAPGEEPDRLVCLHCCPKIPADR